MGKGSLCLSVRSADMGEREGGAVLSNQSTLFLCSLQLKLYAVNTLRVISCSLVTVPRYVPLGATQCRSHA